MPSPLSVSKIKSQLLSPALTSHFEVVIGIPKDLQSVLGINQERLNLMCSEASLPGSQLTTLELTNDRTGVTEKHAYRRLFDDRLDLTFYVDAKNYIPIKFFETWIQYIMNENPQETIRKNYAYRVKYPDDYISDQGLIVRKFEKDYKSVLEYEFVRSFPLAISSMSVSYDASSLLKCQVSMSYIRYILKGINSPVSATPASAGGVGDGFNTSLNIERPDIPFDSGISAGIIGPDVYNSSTPFTIATQGAINAQALVDDTGLSSDDARTIAGGGFVETLIGG
jgi:hypothetical protein|tara:strand:+ start:53 stop:898 length:846 start_codon:yes stop_codon:yes gene_type:complete